MDQTLSREHESLLRFRIIGSPPEDDWPDYCSLPWGQFMGYIHVPLKRLIPEMCDEGEDLLKV